MLGPKWLVDAYSVELDTWLPRDLIRFWTRRGAETWRNEMNALEARGVYHQRRYVKIVYVVGRVDNEPGWGN